MDVMQRIVRDQSDVSFDIDDLKPQQEKIAEFYATDTVLLMDHKINAYQLKKELNYHRSSCWQRFVHH